MNEWETVNTCLHSRTERLKVEGGWVYKTTSLLVHEYSEERSLCENICYVPDVDLTRYQAHLRDAYNKGFEDGRNKK